MTYTQLKQPDLNVIGQEGLCLAYVTEVFGVPNFYPSAINAWQNAQLPHANEQPPTDVSVPVFFSYNGPFGHVAVSVPGKGVYSTSALGDEIFSDVAHLVSWMGEGMTYLGWSEDVNKVKVVQGVTDMITTANDLKYLYLGVYAQDTPDATLATDGFIGQDLGDVTMKVLDYANKNGFAYWQVKPKLEKQIADLQAELAAKPTPPTPTPTPVVVPTPPPAVASPPAPASDPVALPPAVVTVSPPERLVVHHQSLLLDIIAWIKSVLHL